MKLIIKHQESYSRGELLLRAIFGWAYIMLPHIFVLLFVQIWASILLLISWFSILFTGRFPQSNFEFLVGILKWGLRVNARVYNLSDGYPAFGVNATDEHTSLDVEYPESLSRGHLLLKTFFGAIYCAFPHAFVLMFRMLWGMILSFLAFWAVLFTGNYPEKWHAFNVGTIRWSTRVNLYLSFMTDDYPPFSGKE
jgi:hypothetical protein